MALKITSEESSFQKWDLEINPKVRFFDLNLIEVWKYRDLVWLFVRRDFLAQYQQTILGPLWHLIQPILTTLMFLLVFGKIAHIPTDGINPILFYMAGITLWNYFSSCLTNISNTFVSNANIFGKVYFPRLVIPLSVVMSNIVRFSIQLFLLFLAMIWFAFNGKPTAVTINWLFIPLLILLIAGIGLGVGIIISSLTNKYRDLTVLLTFAVQLGMYATPVVYPLSYLKNTQYKWLIEINPLTSVFEMFRYVLFGKGTFDVFHIFYAVIFMVVTLLIGLIIFNRVEKTFMDTV